MLSQAVMQETSRLGNGMSVSSRRTPQGKIADEYAAKYPDIVKVVHQENKGHGGGINSGIATATGKYFKVVDSDDSLDEKSLLTALDALENSEVDMFVSNYKYTHEVKSVSVVIFIGIKFTTAILNGRISCVDARSLSITNMLSFFRSSIAGNLLGRFKGITPNS